MKNQKHKKLIRYASLIMSAATIILIIFVSTRNKKENTEVDENITAVNKKDAESVSDNLSSTAVSTTFTTEISQTDTLVSSPAVTENTKKLPDSDIMTEVINEVNSLILDGSPAATNYKENNYAELYTRYDNFEYIDNSNGFTISNSDPEGMSLTYRYRYNKYDLSYTHHKFSCSDLTETDAGQYRRLLDYIDSNAGSDRYYIYDIYNYNYTLSYEAYGSGEFTKNSSSECNYGISIVLKDYLNEYNTCGKNKYVISFEIMNDKATGSNNGIEFSDTKLDAVLSSEYEEFIMKYPLVSKICNEFTDKFDNCAIDIAVPGFTMNWLYKDEYKYLYDSSPVGSDVQEAPYWPKDSSQNNKSPYKLNTGNHSIFSEIISSTESYHDSGSYASLYFKPGTTKNDMEKALQEMAAFLGEHNIYHITADILNSDETFDQARNNNGYIPDSVVDSSCRNCYFVNISDGEIRIEMGWPGK